MRHVVSTLACRHRKRTHRSESAQITQAKLLPVVSPQLRTHSWPSELPETTLAIVLEFAGAYAWYSASCVNRQWHETLWQSTTLWSCALLSMNEEPGRVEQDACRQRDRTRKCWFGVTNFLMQGPLTIGGCDVTVMEEASRAIKGLRSTDSEEEICQAFQRCVTLL